MFKKRIFILILLGFRLFCHAQNNIPKLVVNLGHTQAIDHIQLTTNQKYIISQSKSETKLWDFKTGRLIRNIPKIGDIIINDDATQYAHNGKIYNLTNDSLLFKVSIWQKKRNDSFDRAIDFKTKYIVFESGVYDIVSKNIIKYAPIGKLSLDEKYILSDDFIYEISTKSYKIKYKYTYLSKVFDTKNYKYLTYQTSDDKTTADTISVLDVFSNKVIKNIDYNPAAPFINSPRCFAISSQYVITGSGFQYGFSRTNSRDTTIKIYDIKTGQLLKTLPGHVLSVEQLIITNDEKFLISSGNDRIIRIWDINTGALFMKLGGISTGVNSVKFNKDGTKLASSGDAPRIWDLKIGNLYKRFKGHSDIVSSIAFLKNDTALVSSSFDKSIKIWDINTGLLKRNLRGHTNRIYHLELSKDGRTLISTTATGAIPDRLGIDKTALDKKMSYKKWDLSNGKQVLTGYATHTTALSPDGKLLLIYRQGYTQTEEEKEDGGKFRIALLNNETGEKISEIRIQGDFVDYDNYEPTFQFLSDSKTAIIAYGNRITFFDTDTGWYAINTPKNVSIRCLSINKTEKIIAVGCDNGSIYLFDIIKQQFYAVLQGHQSDVLSLDFSPDGKKLASGSLDTQVKLWDLETNTEIVSFIGINSSDEYITYSPDGYYMSSKGATQALHFILNGEVFLFDQFDIKYNRPDTILHKLSSIETNLMHLYKEAYYKRLKKAGLKKEDLNQNFEIPKIDLFTINQINDKVEYSINASCNYNGLISTMYIWVNDVPLHGSNGYVFANKQKQMSHSGSLQLSKGLNKIQIALSDNHGIESLKQTYYFSNFTKDISQLYLIGISVSQYKDQSFNLKYAVKDGRDFSNLLSSFNNNIIVDTLFDNNALKSNIQLLRKQLLKTHVNDIVIFYISGHGLLDQNQDFYYATHDVDFANPQAQGYSYQAIDNLLDSIPCRKKLLLIDACHSGDVDKDENMPDINIVKKESTANEVNIVYNARGAGFKNVKSISKSGYSSFELMQELFSNINRGNGTIVLSASAGNSFALESDAWQNGIFTYCLLKGIQDKEADTNNDSIINVNELKSYVSNKVVEMTNGQQRPTSRQQNLEFDWEIPTK